MGIVYRARDRTLDREVAVKVLLDGHTPDTGVARRFLDEARITSQLQHPGIPAVYQVGTMADGRPFLAMKLIKGHTLAELVKSSEDVDTLSVFSAISQAVGYAHAHGVIHRDLKPANVMVGMYGEVQVMDWGLAKVLASGGVQPRRSESDPEATAGPTVIRSERDLDTPFTQYGSMLGTPAYMAPEQAAGELDKLGPPADVFGLGAILCTLLTGKPPYDGNDAESVRIAAVRGQTAPALARLDACAADPEVIALCKRCLAFDPGERPGTAVAVAAEVAALRWAADERARQAERDKLAADVRAAEQAKRRRAVQWAAGAVAAVLLFGVVGTGIGMFRADAARHEREAALREREAALADAYTGFGLMADERRDPAQAALWFANAALLAEGDAGRRELNAFRARVWGRHAYTPTARIDRPLSSTAYQDFAFHPSGQFLLTFDARLDSNHIDRAECRLWDLVTEQAHALSERLASAGAAAWSPDGRWLAVGGSGDGVTVLDFPGGSTAFRLEHSGPVRRLAFSADGHYLALADAGSARVWDCRTRTFATPVLAHPGPVDVLAFNARGDRLATACRDGFARVYDLEPTAAGPRFGPRPHAPWWVGIIGARPYAPMFVEDDRTLLTLHQDRFMVHPEVARAAQVVCGFNPRSIPLTLDASRGSQGS
jgi:hypothetical protein